MTPEEKARQQIDAMLVASGWTVQTRDKINLAASPGVAVCELSFKTGEPDYTLFVDGKAIGMDKAKAGVSFAPDQLTWLSLIRDHIATSLSIEPDDLDLSPFSQRGGLGKAHQLFGDKLLPLLDELNQTLAA